MIVEFRRGYDDSVQLDAKELMKLMEFVREYITRDCTTRVRDESERIVVETSGTKISQAFLIYDPNKTEET